MHPGAQGESTLGGDPPDAAASLGVSIPAPRERQDEVVREAISPLVASLRAERGLHTLHFERLNKPDWRLALRVFGDPGWLLVRARALVERGLGESARRGLVTGFEFVPDEGGDKWVGGGSEMPLLRDIYFVDTVACLDLMDAEARGALAITRAEWSLVLVERMLDLFALADSDRLEFYERGYRWEFDLGRWNDGVIEALEARYRGQRRALATVLGRASGPPAGAPWGGAEATRIALHCLDAIREPVEAVRSAEAESRLGTDLLGVAVFVGHAHSNRLGIHATQEAVMRWLVRRARLDAGS